jgi:hypothetical protein
MFVLSRHVSFSPEFKRGNLDFKKVKPSLAIIVAGEGFFSFKGEV